MSNIVLDASALLAWLLHEPGREIVAETLIGEDSVLSAVNLTEVATKLLDDGIAESTVAETLREIPVLVVEFDGERALAAANLRSATRSLGLSLGGRACLALARELDSPVLTADRKWLQLNLGIEVRLARPGAD